MENSLCERLFSLQAISMAWVTITLLAALWPNSALAEESTFATYGAERGLTNLEGAMLNQDRGGDILLATEHGVFAFDGRSFINLGPEQGLPSGGEINSVALASSGRLAIQFPGEIYVSDTPSTPLHPASSLFFHALIHPGIHFYDEQPHRIASWGSDFVALAGDRTIRVVVPLNGQAHGESMPYNQQESASLSGAKAIFSVAGHLWETFEDGRICAADPGKVRCYAAADGLTQGPWFDIVEGDGGRVMARSVSAVAVFKSGANLWSSAIIPDQGGRYEPYRSDLGLYHTPDGKLITQAIHGLDVLDSNGWHELTVANGAPNGTIVSAMTDAAGQLWFHVLGRGLVRWVGYGHWDTLVQANGLSGGYPWQTARSIDGSLWITTDSGVERVLDDGSLRHVSKFSSIASYALAATTRDVWAGYSDKGVQVINPVTGSVAVMGIPAVNTIVQGEHGVIWIGTVAGLYKVDDSAGPPFHPALVEALKAPVNSIKPDGRGGIYYLSSNRLHHLHQDNVDSSLDGTDFPSTFEPLSMVIAKDRALWVGGLGGLFRLTHRADQIVSSTSISTEYIGSNSVIALMIDHRGWVWVGDDHGVMAYDGQRWVATDVDQGLLSNDLNEDGLREDPDGSIWMTTSRGVSHLRDPASLFDDHVPKVIIRSAHLGSRAVGVGTLPYNHDPLLIVLGTPNYGERPVVFQYRLSDVDGGWVSSSSASFRYPFIPPGRHVLTVLAMDLLTHRQSKATELVVDVDFPWWRQWWAEGLWGTCILAIVYFGTRFRSRAIHVRQAELRRQIAEATAHIRHQAAHDQLTGLLIRSEVESRLAERLRGDEPNGELVIALIDVDHFKDVNDTFGHLGGDEVLRSLGGIVTSCLSHGEFAGRYGGEEILLVLNDGDGFAAERVLDLHLTVRQYAFKAGRSQTNVTCSIGVAWASEGDRWESLIGRADTALYEAKDGGRNRVAESRPHGALMPRPLLRSAARSVGDDPDPSMPQPRRP